MKEDVVAANLSNVRQAIDNVGKKVEDLLTKASKEKNESPAPATEIDEKAVFTVIAKSFCKCWNEFWSVVRLSVWRDGESPLPFAQWFPRFWALIQQKGRILEHVEKHLTEQEKREDKLGQKLDVLSKGQAEMLEQIKQLNQPIVVRFVPPNVNGLFIRGYHLPLRYVVIVIVFLFSWAMFASVKSLKHKEEAFAYYSMYQAVKEQCERVMDE